MKMKAYYSLVEFCPTDRTWSPQFGDYDRDVAVEEMRSVIEARRYPKGTKYKVIKTGDTVESISAAVAVMNIGNLQR